MIHRAYALFHDYLRNKQDRRGYKPRLHWICVSPDTYTLGIQRSTNIFFSLP